MVSDDHGPYRTGISPSQVLVVAAGYALLIAISRATLHSKRTASSTPVLCLSLHLLADLDVDLEELGDAAVEADRLAFVEIGLAVVLVDAFLRARLDQPEKTIGN
jgi:hypothetical protein